MKSTVHFASKAPKSMALQTCSDVEKKANLGVKQSQSLEKAGAALWKAPDRSLMSRRFETCGGDVMSMEISLGTSTLPRNDTPGAVP